MKRFLYLLYYIRETPRKKFAKFMDYAHKESGLSKGRLYLDVVYSVIYHKVSILDYFYFKFYTKSKEERSKWAGTGYMYEYQVRMNPKNSRGILEDKNIFLKTYGDFVKHGHVALYEIKSGANEFNEVIKNPSGKVVLKDATGQCGLGIEVFRADEWSKDSLIEYMNKKGYDLMEAFIQQHADLQKLSPSGLNTIRIFTQLNRQDDVVILGCRLRITVNSYVDNLASGNLAAEIDNVTGIVCSDAVYSDITKESCAVHPITGVTIKGFQIPFWPETLELANNAALHNKDNRSVGWDIAITDKGPELLEGNHNWCKLLWQLPVQKGLKHLIEPYKV